MADTANPLGQRFSVYEAVEKVRSWLGDATYGDVMSTIAVRGPSPMPANFKRYVLMISNMLPAARGCMVIFDADQHQFVVVDDTQLLTHRIVVTGKELLTTITANYNYWFVPTKYEHLLQPKAAHQ